MKIVHINQFEGIGSTGRIMDELCNVASENDFRCYMVSAFSIHNGDKIYSTEKLPLYYGTRLNLFMSRITGFNGYTSKFKTKQLLTWIDNIAPDIIHLHNIHGNWINLDLLFDYLSSKNIFVVWTLHDTWSFTGRCAILKEPICEKWINGCVDCPNLGIYPSSYFLDFSNKMWKDKKKWISKLKGVTIVSPSHWLDGLVAKSFLQKFNHLVIHNGIDVNAFHCFDTPSPLLKIEGKKNIILGVASAWSNDKGFQDFIQLSKIIDNNNYVIVLVGVDERRKRMLPNTVITISRTNSVDELAHIYSSTSVYVNATYAESLGLTNIEANACGTPVVTYNSGGAVETISKSSGIVVQTGDVDGLWEAISQICENRDKYNSCRENALKNFDKNNRYMEYLRIYKHLLHI